MKSHHIRLLWLQLIICFVAAFDINIDGHWYLLERAFVSPMFYVAFCVSFMICFLLLYLMHRINLRLEIDFPWSKKWKMRLFRQVTDGIIFPAVIDLILIVNYFLITGKSDQLSAHLNYEYRRVVHFIIGINLVYILVEYLRSVKSKKYSDMISLPIKHNGADLILNAASDVLFVLKDGRNIRVVTISGNSYTKKDTINGFKNSFEAIGFCKVNPSAVINLQMLKGYATGIRSKTLEPLFRPQFKEKISKSDLEKIRVTREYLTSFKKEMKKYMAGEVQI